MLLEIISPDKVIYTGEVQSVRLPGKDGYFEILKDHAPLISLLQAGEIKVVDQNGSTETFNTNKGFVEVVDNTITVLV
ncbi:MAG: ATP synthase F1 subunit epsilon [Bacteroidetes bacterium]|jgi:F-type H+-transporting ATPase subunit epsilon|nr:ATP synthase F1 subunit epsilon [Bacteroidota bacterium]MBT3424673.1 ATP synthase F1 subunit epsilon [Bacteroidota bacterium]MBT3802803.1 ATP synthase F1 subunit epsilon [Bacteroidota bacterium]MBT5992626.1 ATP synthase F1 subunit epsilon [Bacteroidota bacterium]MBT7041304.1 ATP synthase F1 subunit epsilon [Bacteroidota bacterium]